ncbi:prolipoprotein diacylglyceryl transferase [Luteimonas aquatica]|uniref:prolipoprotein diacylglyceryl transferase n=1 Tax=Luteimonas aquatica TaxID=450364 RepID=UPI001F58F4D9|nr:prolipoprotein diacylglyceryl transferase [Luteimonas aquatica]
MFYLHQIDPIAIHIGSRGVHWYGIMYLLGFLAAWFLGRARVKAGRLPGVDANAYGDLMFYAMLGVVLGGRLGYILFYDLRTYIDNPLQIVKIWEGGMSFHGGLLGVVAAMFWWARKHKLAFFDVADFIAPLVPPGLGFGRLGNFINGELWGKPTGGTWGVVFPQDPDVTRLRLGAEALRAQFEAGTLNIYARHPSQLYQFALEGVAMFAILWWFSSRPRPRYAVSGLFALLYGVFRFAVEFVRLPDQQLGYLAFGWLTMGQALSLPLILIGLFWLWKSRKAPTLQPQPAAPPANA